MNQSLKVIVSAYVVHEKRMELLANNLANVNTSGFKEDRPLFQVTDTGGNALPGNPAVVAPAPSGGVLPVNLMSRLQNNLIDFVGVKTDFSQGELQPTGNKLDLALRGSGFFAVSTPEGTRYTRSGNFGLNEEGTLVTQDGFPVLGKTGPIELEGEQVVVREDGAISAGNVTVDSLMIVDAPSPHLLRKVGGSLFAASGLPLPEKDPEEIEVLQGFLEASNVNVIKEMVTLIEVTRAYESYQKVVHSWNEVLSKSVNEIGRLI